MIKPSFTLHLKTPNRGAYQVFEADDASMAWPEETAREYLLSDEAKSEGLKDGDLLVGVYVDCDGDVTVHVFKLSVPTKFTLLGEGSF